MAFHTRSLMLLSGTASYLKPEPPTAGDRFLNRSPLQPFKLFAIYVQIIFYFGHSKFNNKAFYQPAYPLKNILCPFASIPNYCSLARC